MTYNMSLINGSGIVPLINTVNDNLMFGWYGNLALITLFVIFFIAIYTKTQQPHKAFGVSSLFTAISALAFNTMGFVDSYVVVIAWIIAAISMALLFLLPE